MSNYEMEEIADECLQDLHASIDINNHFITAEHELHTKLYVYDNIFGHLDMERIGDADHLHTLNHIIMEGIMSIREFIESNELDDLSFKKEEEHLAKQLSDDIAYKDWQAVKKDVKTAADAQKKHVRVEKHQLKELHRLFKKLLSEIKNSKLLAALEQDHIPLKQKEEYQHEGEHYFVETYRFLRSYEHILKELWEKEEHCAKHIHKNNNKL